eukprot:CAMPEP_0206043336 /NCGR_PEP_ID=MMETSP1466-20131121/8591_1 /ASSEMBLY_ACC=CAM_ASM_001126 /TAXON_ID=44452 /ORGANISM="Pavlova gyrans, Strain CCMP608" /LENGTH=408 /DNA_ID=CAMNT_0053418135 /DNA_START=1 /DNA_END=1227 /DNA_ORIENTATION=+
MTSAAQVLPAAAQAANTPTVAPSSELNPPEASPSGMERAKAVGAAVKKTAIKQCLPLGLVLAIIFGLAVPMLGATVASWEVIGRGVVQTLCVWIIFLISGMTLKTDDVTKALHAWKAIGFGFVSILFITPLLAPAVGALPLPLPPEFSIGFVLFCSMPTTINSGVALVVQAKGSFALALMLTVLTNLIGVFTVPFFLSLVLELGRVRISPVDLLTKLLVLILAPLVVGKALREAVPRVQTFVKEQKQRLSLTANFCLALIPWMKLSESQGDLVDAGGAAVALVIVIGLVIHFVYLAWNYAFARLVLRLPGDELRAVVIMGSQKTLPMAMAVLAALPDSIGAHGLIAVPAIISHLVQIFVDAWIATRWGQREPGLSKEPSPAVRLADDEPGTLDAASEGHVEMAPAQAV